MSIQPFQINVSQEILDDLRNRILRTRWPDVIIGSGWQFGASLSFMKELADYWMNEFDWKKTEHEINSYPNFIGDIDGHKIHFLHVKGKGKKSIPLILIHGWPGSFLEMMKLISHLTESPDVSFDLVIPSLLGYGFSEKVTTLGCSIQLMGELCGKLMKELGYEKFGVQGGDFGSGVGTILAMKYPQNVIGLHLNNIESYFKPYLSEDECLTQEEIQYEKDSMSWDDLEGAYSHQHRTKPLTLSYGLNDSPVGLCAWIIEKFYGWSDCNGLIESIFTKDELLSNITLYWVTETIHSSVRLYNESRKRPLHFKKDDFVQVPVAIAHFPLENPFPPRKYIERGYNVQHWIEMSVGGHFASMEQPALIAEDIMNFFRYLESTK